MITIKNISKKYENKEVLKIDTLEIPKGQSIGFVGNNGAGKTTLFNLILDLIRANSGVITNNDVIVHQSEKWKEFTGSFIDESFLIDYLTAEEYFEFIGELNGMNTSDIELFLSDFQDFFNGEVLSQKKYLRDLSKGNQKKVGIVASLIGNSSVVILDEPFANLDPTTQIRLKKILEKLTERKEITILISSHDLNHVTDVCKRIVVLDKGKIVNDIETSTETLQELEQYFSKNI